MRGKCVPCRRIHQWSGRPRLMDARCGGCLRPLDRTSGALGSRGRTRGLWTLMTVSPVVVVTSPRGGKEVSHGA